MSGPDPRPEPTSVPAVLCRRLRSNGMYVRTDGSPREMDGYDSTMYWCLRSMTSFGPDDQCVDRMACSDPSRSCYEPL